MLRDEALYYLREKLIPFWNGLIDKEYGGFYGYVGFDLKVDKKAVKGAILNSRILWFYSSAYEQLKDASLLEYAGHAFEFLKNFLWDEQKGGIIWSAKYNGDAHDTLKHSYCLSFALYALSAYCRVSGDEQARLMAHSLFNLIETVCKADKGYYEAFSKDFEPASNEELSENGVMATRTMNTTLHILEAYTEYSKINDSIVVTDALENVLRIFSEYIFDRKHDKLLVFFDDDFNSIIDLNSYGHDIEATWLLDKACEVIKDQKLIKEITEFDTRVAHRIHEIALEGCAVNNESENGVINRDRIWWVHAESVVGFLNAYSKTGDEKFKKATDDVWEYIKEFFIDKREGSEWFSQLSPEGKPFESYAIVEPWKCPYHNGRMFIEILKRVLE